MKGTEITSDEVHKIDQAVDVKLRCNPARAESALARDNKVRKTEQRRLENQYDPSDFIDQRFNEAGYEQAVALSPEDAIIEAIDAARLANSSIDDLLNGTTTWTKPRGKGRPKKESV